MDNFDLTGITLILVLCYAVIAALTGIQFHFEMVWKLVFLVFGIELLVSAFDRLL